MSDPPTANLSTKRPSFLERHLLLCLTACSALALFWPEDAARWDPFLATASSISWMVGCTMFLVGWMLPPSQVAAVGRRGHLVVFGTTLQYLSMPLLAWTVGKAFQLEGAAWTGVMLVGAVPGAMASNVLTLNARGNASYSVSLTTVATLLSPLLVPLALSVTLGKEVSLDPRRVISILVVTVVLPVILGHLLRRLKPEWSVAADKAGPLAANLTILLIIGIVVAQNRERLAGASWTLIIPLLVLNAVGYSAGYAGGSALRLPESMRRALTLEIGMQNAGVGTMLAVKLFDDPAIALPPALYTFGCMLTGTMLARFWALRPPDSQANSDA